MAGTIRVDIVADADKFVAAMKKADKAAGDFQASTKGTSDALEDTQTHARGAVDILDGLEETFGLNTGAAMAYGRGVKDLADGFKTTLIPAAKGAAASIQRIGWAMAATPWGRVALGVVAVGTAFAATNANGSELKTTIDAFKTGIEYDVNKLKGWSSAVLGFFGVAKSGAAEFGYAMDDLGYNTLAVAPAAEELSRRQLAASQTFGAAIAAEQASVARLAAQVSAATASALRNKLALQFGGTPDDPDGAFASAAAVAAATVDRTGEGIVSVYTDLAKKVKSGASKLHKAAVDSFNDLKPKLEAASQRFADSSTIKDNILKGFGLDFSDDIGHSVEEGLRRQVDRFKEFTRKIASLRKMGLNPGLINQFVDAGPGSLDELNRINSGNYKTINDLAKQAGVTGGNFASAEAMRRTGTDPNKPVKVTLDVKGGQKELVDLIKKWVRTEGGGNVQVAFK